MAAKRRPSFNPEPASSGAPPATDWVYRSDAPAGTGAAPPARKSRAAKAAPRPRAARRRAVDKTGALLAPVALLHLCLVEPIVTCMRRWLRAA